jgi:neutral trehalase
VNHSKLKTSQQPRENNEEAEKFREKAREAADFINTVWWNNTKNQYFSYLNEVQ